MSDSRPPFGTPPRDASETNLFFSFPVSRVCFDGLALPLPIRSSMNRSDLRVIADRSIFRSKIAGEKEEEEERERERAKRGVGLVVETSLFLAENSRFFRRVELGEKRERGCLF